MPWVKLDDQFFANPKVVDLSKDAKLLYLSGLTYSAGQLTDGRITPGGLRIIASTVDVAPGCAAELVHAGVWQRDGRDFVVHDFLEYNPSAADVRRRRQLDRERKRRYFNEELHAESTQNPHAVATDSNGPVPRPLPSTNLANVRGEEEESRVRAPAPARPRVRAPLPVTDDIVATADVLTHAGWIDAATDDVQQRVARSFTLVGEFPARAGPLEAEHFAVYHQRKPPANWYRAWLVWLKRWIEFSNPAAPVRQRQRLREPDFTAIDAFSPGLKLVDP